MSQINQVFFQEIFGFLSENQSINEDLKPQLDHAIKALYTYIIYLDKLYDNEIQKLPNLEGKNPLFELTQHHEYSVVQLQNIFGVNNPLGEKKNGYLKIYFDELLLEKELTFETINLNYDRFKTLAINKHIPSLFVTDCIKYLNHNYPLEEVQNMLKHIFIGIQLYDDITDIGEDLENNQLTFIIYKTIIYLKDENDFHPDDITYTKKAFFAIEEISDPIFKLMLEEFNDAKTIASNHNFSKVNEWLDIIISQINDWHSQIEKIRNESFA